MERTPDREHGRITELLGIMQRWIEAQGQDWQER